jgi:hypothetical protein
VSGDAQPERGRFAFSVGRPTAPAALLPGDGRTASGSGFVLAVVGRALHFLGYALGFGSLAFRWFVLRPLGASRVAALDRALWRLPRFGVVALLLAEPLVLLGHSLRLGIVGDADVLADVLVSRVGLVTGQRLGIALALWAMLTALETGSRVTLELALALGVALAVIDGQAVHAVSVRPVAAGLVANALHVAAMGYVGGPGDRPARRVAGRGRRSTTRRPREADGAGRDHRVTRRGWQRRAALIPAPYRPG